MAGKSDDIELLWTELEVFSKLLARGRNQHRREKYYQMLVRVRCALLSTISIYLCFYGCVQVMKDLRKYKRLHIDRKKVPRMLKL